MDISSTPDDEVATLCARAGLTFNDIAFHEGQAVVVATDGDGVRGFYTLSTLNALAQRAAGNEANHQRILSPAPRHQTNPSPLSSHSAEQMSQHTRQKSGWKRGASR